jgi:EmrB/QacA subfamily drug resistance transporter
MDMAKRDTREYRLRWWTLIVIALSVLIVVIDASIVNVALPTLQRELTASGSELQWIVDGYILAFAALMLTMGALGDRLGRAHMLRLGMIIFAGASLAAIFAESPAHLIVARVVMGVGGAMILPATLAIITNVFPREERGKAIGAWAGMNGIGIALGPIIGGLLIEHFDWSSIFIINLPIAAVALLAGMSLSPNSRDPDVKSPDIPGTVLSTAALCLLVFGLIRGGEWGWTDPGVVGCLAGSLAVMGLFVFWELRTKNPLLDLSFFRSRRFSAGVGSVTIIALSQMGLTFALTLYMQFVKGYSALDTGIRFAPIAAGIVFGAGLADFAVKRIGTGRVMSMGFLGMAAASGAAAFWQVDTAFWQIGVVFFAWGFFLGAIAAPAADAIMGAIPEARAGVGSAVNSVSRLVAGAIGVAALGAVLNSIYSTRFEQSAGALPDLPPGVAEAASDSVGVAVTVADGLPPALGEGLAQIARTSFMDGWQLMALIACGLAVVGAAFALRFMPAEHEAVPDLKAQPETAG